MDSNRRAEAKGETRHYWPMLTTYGRFEQLVAFVLGWLIAIVIALALIQLVIRLLPLLLGGAFDLLDHQVFQSVFGTIMTLLIAMEFRHSIIRVALRGDGIIQVKTVILIAILALSRKFVILDIDTIGAATIAALAGTTLALGIVYWLLRERDDRLTALIRDHETPRARGERSEI
jgi:uncharacterized membrane protein (DUF373 family)